MTLESKAHARVMSTGAVLESRHPWGCPPDSKEVLPDWPILPPTHPRRRSRRVELCANLENLNVEICKPMTHP